MTTETLQAKWEAVAARIGATADGIEQNAAELGCEDGTDGFYRECLGQAEDL